MVGLAEQAARSAAAYAVLIVISSMVRQIDLSNMSLLLALFAVSAPEIVRGEAFPSTQTDLFSLSVLILYMLMVAHPLEGKKEAAIKALDLPAMTKLYGKEPIFVFDPDDESNRPVPGIHDNALAFWRIYPQFLRDIFIRAFTMGIRDPQNGRVRESEWRGAMVALRDTIFYCAHCSLENFYDAQALKAAGGNPGLCWACAARLQLPPRIRINKSVVLLNHDAKLFPHHVDDTRLYDFSSPVAAVAWRPRRRGSRSRWRCSHPSDRSSRRRRPP